MAGHLNFFSSSPHSFSDNNSSPSGLRKENVSFFSVLLVFLKLRCAWSSPLHSPPHHWAAPQLNEPLSVFLSECFLPQQQEQGQVAAWPMLLCHLLLLVPPPVCRGSSKDSAVTSATHSHPKQHGRCWVGRATSCSSFSTAHCKQAHSKRMELLSREKY